MQSMVTRLTHTLSSWWGLTLHGEDRALPEGKRREFSAIGYEQRVLRATNAGGTCSRWAAKNNTECAKIFKEGFMIFWRK